MQSVGRDGEHVLPPGGIERTTRSKVTIKERKRDSLWSLFMSYYTIVGYIRLIAQILWDGKLKSEL